MATLSMEFKKKIAHLYLENGRRLDSLDPSALESFATTVLQAIEIEKGKVGSSHDLDVLEQSMKHLSHDTAQLKNYEPETDEYDFAKNDCKNLINSTKKWLEMEKLM